MTHRPRSASLTRRTMVHLPLALPFIVTGATAATHTAMDKPDAIAALQTIEADAGGRIGVYALNLSTNQHITYRGDERFAMCSTFKWLLSGLVMHRVDKGEEQLDRLISYTEADIAAYSPVTRPMVGKGLSVRALCAAATQRSDNTAANLLLATLGGPSGFTARLRKLGDDTTRVDRWEPEMNQNLPGDPRDTTTPMAMAHTMQRFLFEDTLSPSSRQLLRDWMITATTGLNRLRTGLPAGWTAGDKTGTSNNRTDNDANNDLAFALPPTGTANGPLIITSFINAPDPMSPATSAFHGRIAQALVRQLV